MIVRITYAITVCNEIKELIRLVDKLYAHLREGDQILVVYDLDNGTPDVLEYLMFKCDEAAAHASDEHQKTFVFIATRLQKDFASFKNQITQHASGDYIFQIDADEYPTDDLLEALPDILSDDCPDVIVVPRINTVDGITSDHIEQWGWSVTTLPSGISAINFPDYQWRIYKNKPEIRWVNKVHEKLSGHDDYGILPPDPTWCLIHPKNIDRQEKQNQFYETIHRG